MNKRLATRSIFSLALFDVKARLKLPACNYIGDEKFSSFEVDKNNTPFVVPVTEYVGSVDVLRKQLHELVDNVCNTFEG